MSICEKLVQGLSDYFVLLTSVRDDLVTDDGNQVLSARQGMVLKNLVDSLDPELVKGLASKDWVKMYIKQPFTLSLSVDNPFVVSGESFTLSATLLNSEGVGVYGEEVVLTGSDGSLNSAITNNSGVANFVISSIEDDVTYTCTYEDLTATCSVELCYMYDVATSTSYTENAWYLGAYTFEREADGTVFTNPSSTHWLAPSIDGGTSYLLLNYNKEWEFIFDLVDYGIGGFSVGLANNSFSLNHRYTRSALGLTKGSTCKIRVTSDKITFFTNDVVKEEIVNDYTVPFLFHFILYSSDSFKIKDFRIKEI